MALEGDAKHLFSYVMSSVGVVIGLIVAVVTGLYIIDPIIALIVAALLVKMGIDVCRKTAHDLMDSACEEEEKLIVAVLEKDPQYLEYHELKTRRSGNHIFMEVHICINGEVTLSEGQAVVSKLEDELISAVPGIVPTIRLEDHTKCLRYGVEGRTGPA
jgi:cation diffusion facilitator family transporter